MHCETCRSVVGHPARVGALFRVMLSADEDLYRALERLCALFPDHSEPARHQRAA